MVLFRTTGDYLMKNQSLQAKGNKYATLQSSALWGIVPEEHTSLLYPICASTVTVWERVPLRGKNYLKKSAFLFASSHIVWESGRLIPDFLCRNK